MTRQRAGILLRALLALAVSWAIGHSPGAWGGRDPARSPGTLVASYNILTQVGLNGQEISDNSWIIAAISGEAVKMVSWCEDARKRFGRGPSDLSAVAWCWASSGGCGADWPGTGQLRYRGNSPVSVRHKVASLGEAPPDLWRLPGEQKARFVEQDGGSDKRRDPHQTRVGNDDPGQLAKEEYDEQVVSLVSGFSWMGGAELAGQRWIGWGVLVVMGVLAVLSWLLKRAYWKDVH